MTLQPDDPQQAQAWIRGTAPDQIVDFYIPRGNEGLPGPRGPIGPSLGVGSVTTTSDPNSPNITPSDPKEPEVKVTKNMDELDFDFYIPQGPMKSFAIAMAIAL